MLQEKAAVASTVAVTVRCLPDNSHLYQLDDFPLRDDSVRKVETAILPLHRAVHIQSIAQPVV